MIDHGDWPIIVLTLRAAALSTLFILPPGIALAWLLARRDWPGKSIVETAVALPLVIPPVATGLILLRLFGRHGPLGAFLTGTLGIEIIFTPRAVVLAAAVMSFPLLVRTARVAFAEVPSRLEQIALTLGASPWRVFATITLPLARRGILAGALLAFARALGEFGATILIAGNIPGHTSTIALAIYSLIQLGRDAAALHLLAISLGIAFLAVWASEFFIRSRRP